MSEHLQPNSTDHQKSSLTVSRLNQFSHQECGLGGAVKPGGPIRFCSGPCDVISNTFLRSSSPVRPSATYRRGQKVTIKYNRNNHGPGGFVRLTLVPVDKMMDKQAHSRNAFHYGCWGANSVPATRADFAKDRWGFNIAGGDGSLHNLTKAYHITEITIPIVVPNGNYVLGWAWFGGVGGTIEKNVPARPFPSGFFGDYYSCSFVRIEGGAPVARSYSPVFINDMQSRWPRGCHASADALGVCEVEPCKTLPARQQVPRPFKSGPPPVLKPNQFKPPPCSRPKNKGFCGAAPTPVPFVETLQEAYRKLFFSREKFVGRRC